MTLNNLLAKSPVPCFFRMSYLTNMYALIYSDVEERVGLNRLEFVTLLCVVNLEETTAQDIIGVTGWPKPSMSRAVRSLFERGLITKNSDLNDSRRTLLRPSVVGKKIYDKISPDLVERERRMLLSLSQQEVASLERILNKLVDGATQSLT